MSQADRWSAPYRWSLADQQGIVRLDNPHWPEVEHRYVYRTRDLAEQGCALNSKLGIQGLRAVPVPFVGRG